MSKNPIIREKLASSRGHLWDQFALLNVGKRIYHFRSYNFLSDLLQLPHNQVNYPLQKIVILSCSSLKYVSRKIRDGCTNTNNLFKP